MTTYFYDETGQQISMTDPCGNTTCSDMTGTGHTTTFSYTDSPSGGNPTGNSNTYLTAITKPVTNGVSHIEGYKYNYATGQLIEQDDENTRATTYKYNIQPAGCSYLDKLDRLGEIDYPDGGKTTYCYSDSTSPPSVTTSKLINASTASTTVNLRDGIGHVVQTQLTSDPAGNDNTLTTYDGVGNIYTVSNPYRSTSDVSYGLSTKTYDALGRLTSFQNPDSSSQTWSYSGGSVDFFDETGRHWKRMNDAFGRLTKVLEPDASNNPTIETDYKYDALNNLTRVDQWGGPINNPGDRVRIFNYDSLSRLTSASNPETGTIGYSYDANGNVSTKTDARGVTTTFSYDVLNRLTKKSYSDGTGSALFGYDLSSVNFVPTPSDPSRNLTVTLTNPIGRMVYEGQTAGTQNPNQTLDAFSYDPMGRVAQKWTSTPGYNTNGEPVFSQKFVYDLAGNVASLTYPDGRAVSQIWNAGGNLAQVMDANGNQYLTSQSTYYPDGSHGGMFHGNGTVDGWYPNNRRQWVERGVVRLGTSFGTGSGPGSYSSNMDLSIKQYCYGPAEPAPASSLLPCPSLGSQNNGNILEILDTHVSSRSQAFSYDNLNRLGSFTNGDGGMQQTYTIDPWGNMSQAGTSTFSATYGTNNQIVGGGYDAAGNLHSFNNGISTNTYIYDAASNLINLNNGAAVYTYNPEGNRVRKDVGNIWTEYLYFNGQPMAEKNSDGTWSDYVYANGERMARADNYDIRIHMSGTNCSGCGSTNTFAGTQALTAANGTVVRSGDLLTWRQYQDGVAVGGISLAFNNNTVGSTGVLRDTDGQLTDADTTTGRWHVRVADLTPYAGMTISNLNLYNFQGGAPGNWDIFVGDISLVHTDGTFITLYSRAIEGLAQFPPGAAESNVSVITEKVLDTAPLTTTTYYHGDQVGSSSVLTAGTGWPVSSNIFYPFGAWPLAGTNHYLYTGKERDAESGLDYFGARYYASTMGRFMSPDYQDMDEVDTPLAVPNGALTNPQTLNLYSFTQNNPVSRRDYDGHASWQPCPDGSGAQCWTGDYNGEYNNGLFWNSQSGQWQQNDPNPPDSPAGMVFTGLTRVMLGQSYGFKQMAMGYTQDFFTLGLKSVAISALIPFNRPKFVPSDWVAEPLKGGKSDGIKYVDPNNRANQVLLEKAKPSSPNPGQQVDYMKVLRDGRWLDKNGNPVPNQSLDSHIPQGTELPPDTFGPIP